MELTKMRLENKESLILLLRLTIYTSRKMHIQNGPVLHAVTRENTAEIQYLSSVQITTTVVAIVEVTKETQWIVLEHEYNTHIY